MGTKQKKKNKKNNTGTKIVSSAACFFGFVFLFFGFFFYTHLIYMHLEKRAAICRKMRRGLLFEEKYLLKDRLAIGKKLIDMLVRQGLL